MAFTVTDPLNEWLCDGISATDKACVLAPPVFSTVLKFASAVFTPTGTRPVPQRTHVPPRKVLASAADTVIRMLPTGKIRFANHRTLEKVTAASN